MSAPARPLIVLAAVLATAAAIDACYRGETQAAVNFGKPAPTVVPSLGEPVFTTTTERNDRFNDYANPIDLAALTRAVLAVDADDEGAVNRALLALGAGIPAKSEAEAAHVAEALGRLARNERATVRRGAIALLARMPVGRVVGDPFSAAMLDSDAFVRRHAVVGRTRLGVQFHWRQLTAIAGDRDAGVREAVARGLASVRRPEAHQTLGQLLLDREDCVVEAAGASLARSGAADVMWAAMEASSSSRPNVRRAAALVLSATPSREAYKRLVALTDDEAPSVRKEAVWGLSAVCGEAALDAWVLTEAIAFDAKRRDRSDRFEALQGLARTETEPNLAGLFAVAETDRDALIRVMAARTLALRGDARALPVLVRLLETKPGAGVDYDEAAFVRTTAERALCEVAGRTPATRSSAEWKRALPELEKRLAKGRSGAAVARLAQFW